MNGQSIYKSARSFLFSNVNKQFLIFLFFVLLSGIFWLMTTLNESYEQEVKIPLRVVGVPKSIVLTSATTDTVRVTVNDKGWVIFSYLYGKQLKTINASFKSYDRGNGGGVISSAELKRMVEQQMELSSRVVSIKPDKMEFFYNNGEYKRVPVRWTGRIIPDQMYFISDVKYSPDSIDVYASREKLDSIHAIYTEPLNYVGFRDSLLIECRLSHPNDVKVVPSRISIHFHTDVLTEEVIDGIPIRCINLPPGKVLRTFPAKAKVHFVAGVRQLRGLRAEDFTVVADYNEIVLSRSEKCKIYLHSAPDGISRARLDVSEVDYLIEEE